MILVVLIIIIIINMFSALYRVNILFYSALYTVNILFYYHVSNDKFNCLSS